MNNTALVFIKPHAVREKAVPFILDFLKKKGISFLSEGRLTAEQLDREGIIDKHYAAISNTAVLTPPEELSLSEESKTVFKEKYHCAWEEAVSTGMVLNCDQLKQALPGSTGKDINELWKNSDQCKLAPGLYAGYMEDRSQFVINGFYLGMKELFTAPGCEILWYVVQFSEDTIPWSTFRGDIIGATNPEAAKDGSLRNVILNRWQELGLDYKPHVTENGIHASAGPIEGLKERIVWTGASLDSDPYAGSLLENGISRESLDRWLDNSVETIEGKTEPVFDLTEDLDSSAVIELLKTI